MEWFPTLATGTRTFGVWLPVVRDDGETWLSMDDALRWEAASQKAQALKSTVQSGTSRVNRRQSKRRYGASSQITLPGSAARTSVSAAVTVPSSAARRAS